MSPEVNERFSLGKGRPRPDFKPRGIKCADCGASQSVSDEHSRLVVCEYCGNHLEVTAGEAAVIGRGDDRDWNFPLDLGDDFRHKGHRYEVTARLALIEDGDLLELTRQYLLYNPRRGTMWLSEYKGHYDLSSTTHVMPDGDVFILDRGDKLETHDGRSWVAGDVGVYELRYVDGALPWVAKIGDRQKYAEFSAKDGSGETYEVESHGSEIEYSSGRRIPRDAVQRAMGKTQLPGPAGSLEDVAETRKHYISLIAICAIFAVLNGVFALVLMTKGSKVLDQSFGSSDLGGEIMSQAFEIGKADSVVKIVSAASLDNAWMALDIALVEGDDKVIHVEDADLEYYHGVEGGESWSEGSRKNTTYLRVPEPGTYHLLVHAVSAKGSASQAADCQHNLRIKVYDNAARPMFFIGSAIFSIIALGLAAAKFTNWKQQNGED